MNIEIGNSEDEALVNVIAQEQVEDNQDDIEIGIDIHNALEGISSLFYESNPSIEHTSKQEDVTENDIDFLAALCDDLFVDQDSETPTGNDPTGLNAACITHTNQSEDTDDSNSDSDVNFGLFDESTDVDISFEDYIARLPGRVLANSNDIVSHTVQTESKLRETKNMHCSTKEGFNVLNTGISTGMGNGESKVLKQDYTGPKPDDDDFCCICMDSFTNPKTLTKCSHSFCRECIDEHFKYKPVCPVCSVVYGVITGNQPEGHMSDSISKINLPGYQQYNTIVVSYGFIDGTQTVRVYMYCGYGNDVLVNK